MKIIATDRRGNGLYVEANGVGGHRYWTDEIGGGAMIWDTALGSIEMIELALAHEKEVIKCLISHS